MDCRRARLFAGTELLSLRHASTPIVGTYFSGQDFVFGVVSGFFLLSGGSGESGSLRFGLSSARVASLVPSFPFSTLASLSLKVLLSRACGYWLQVTGVRSQVGYVWDRASIFIAFSYAYSGSEAFSKAWRSASSGDQSNLNQIKLPTFIWKGRISNVR